MIAKNEALTIASNESPGAIRSVEVNALWERYMAWAGRNGLPPVDRRRFNERLEGEGCRRVNRRIDGVQRKKWLGVSALTVTVRYAA